MLHLAHFKKERDMELVSKLEDRTACDTFRFYRNKALRVFKIAKKNGVFQNLLHLGIRKINKTQRKCQHQNKNCVSCCCFQDYRPSVAATFLLKLSLCFLSGPTVLWNLIWKHRLCLLPFLLFYHIMIVWPPMLNKNTKCDAMPIKAQGGGGPSLHIVNQGCPHFIKNCRIWLGD